MLLFLGEEHKQHLSLLHMNSDSVLIDFCKLANDYINNGPNAKRYNLAADKLEVEAMDIQNCIQAIVFLLIEACKYNLSESDLKNTLSMANFSANHQEVLVQFYKAKKNEITNALCKLADQYTSYQDLEWKFQIQVSNNKGIEDLKPNIQIDLALATPKPINLVDKTFKKQNEYRTVSSTEISEAKTASECQNMIEHVKLNCDLPNLINMTSKLEQAFVEVKSHHVRRIQRALQKK